MDCWSSVQHVGLPQPQQRSGNLQQHLRHHLHELKVGQVVDEDPATTTEAHLPRIRLPVVLHITVAAMASASPSVDTHYRAGDWRRRGRRWIRIRIRGQWMKTMSWADFYSSRTATCSCFYLMPRTVS